MSLIRGSHSAGQACLESLIWRSCAFWALYQAQPGGGRVLSRCHAMISRPHCRRCHMEAKAALKTRLYLWRRGQGISKEPCGRQGRCCNQPSSPAESCAGGVRLGRGQAWKPQSLMEPQDPRALVTLRCRSHPPSRELEISLQYRDKQTESSRQIDARPGEEKINGWSFQGSVNRFTSGTRDVVISRQDSGKVRIMVRQVRNQSSNIHYTVPQ